MRFKIKINDWQILRSRYATNKAYMKRTALSPVYFEIYANWLVDHGADVYANTEQNEILRFNLNGELGIWFKNSSGNLLMHELAEKFKQEIYL